MLAVVCIALAVIVVFSIVTNAGGLTSVATKLHTKPWSLSMSVYATICWVLDKSKFLINVMSFS